MSPLQQYAADHRYLLELVAKQVGMSDLQVIDLDEFYEPLMRQAKKAGIFPIEGVLVRDWDPDSRKVYPGVQMGCRLYEIEGIKIVRVRFAFSTYQNAWPFDFTAVEKKNYLKLYKVALKAKRDDQKPTDPPVMPIEQKEILWQNTIGYLDRLNLGRIKAYGGRAKRGVLLMGPPGNGKTSACRWIWSECRRRRWEWKLVTPDAYRQARSTDSIEELFSVDRRGIVFFDDMDQALRDRETVHESEDQAVFLSALDGIQVNEGVVFVFTTNCALELIDRAFKRPGRIDVVLQFEPPNHLLRRELVERWHEDIRHGINLDEAVETTQGYSFAEIEELKNLLILNYMEKNRWDWDAALKQFEINRHEFNPNRRSRRVGFGTRDEAMEFE